MSRRKVQTKARHRKSPGSKDLELLAATAIVPWPKTEKLNGVCIYEPTHEQWHAWNNSYGALLRIANGIMTLSKEELAGAAGDFERDGTLDEQLIAFREAEEFFRGNADLVSAASARLIIGAAVHLQATAGLVRGTKNKALRSHTRAV